MLPLAVAQFSSDVSAVRYVLPGLWITLCFQTNQTLLKPLQI